LFDFSHVFTHEDVRIYYKHYAKIDLYCSWIWHYRLWCNSNGINAL